MLQSKAESAAYAAEQRAGFLREVLGIVLGLVALLVFLALLSAVNRANWIGPVGDGIAATLFFILGRYVAFALPVMLAICAFHALRGISPRATRGHSWLRGAGGLLILISTCALFTLSAPLNQAPLKHSSYTSRYSHTSTRSTLDAGSRTYGKSAGSKQAPTQAVTRAFEMGGLVGNLMVDSNGLNIGLLLGRVGAFIIFCGLTLIGLVFFTETLLRDLASMCWGSTQRVMNGGIQFDWAAHLPRFGFLKRLACLARPFTLLAELHPLAWFQGLLARLKLPAREPRSARTLGGASTGGRSARSNGSVFGRPSSGGRFAPPPQIDRDPDDEDGEQDEELGYADERYAEAADEGYEDTEEREDYEAGAYYAEDEREEDDEPRERGARSRNSVFRRTPAAAPEHLVLDFDSPADKIPAAGHVPAESPTGKRTKPVPVQHEMDLFPREFKLPPLELLADPPTMVYEMSDEEKDRLSRRIEQTLAQFKVEVEVFEVIQGPVITRFALKVAPGVRVNKIQALESELAMALKAQHVRILAPIPGQSAVGIEVPNKRSNPVVLRDLLDSDPFRNHKSPLAFALGKNISGETVVCDLAQMPHLLIAGATGSGKSVCLNAIIASLLYRNKPDRVKFVMVDPKRVELSIYQAIPHLIAPVVSETKKAAAALAWCVEQMESRYKLLAEIGVRNLDSYNALLLEKTPNKKLMGRDLKFLPHIVIIIDELADLMMVAKNEVEEYIIRLAQMARAVGMHLVLATQRPSVNVITGIIKANFPSRIAFQVSSKVDSRTILDLNGAEALMGRGDMLYSPGGAKPFRIQGAYVADAEVERLADYIREQEKVRYEKEDFEARPTPAERAKAHLKLDGDGADMDEGEDQPYAGGEYGEHGTIDLGGMAVQGRAGSAPLTPADVDLLSDQDLYDMALKLILESRKASVSYIQRRMKIGYARAGRIMDLLEEDGIVGPYQGSKPRDLLVDPAEYLSGKQGEQ